MVDSLRWESQRGIGFDLLTPRGELVLSTAPELRRRLVKGLLDHGRLVVDLRALALRSAAAAMVFPTALGQAGGWPRSRLAMFGATEAMSRSLRDNRIGELVPVRGDLTTAVAALQERPDRVRRATWLVAGPDLGTQARDFVAGCRRDWCLGEGLDPDAAERVNELMSTVGTLPDTMLELSVELGGSGLRVCVRAWLPEGPGPDPVGPAGRPPRRDMIPHQDGFTVWTVLGGPTLINR